jgi:hypothetical protein
MPASSFFLALPAELFLRIFEDSELCEDDHANLRLVCKDFSLYATPILADHYFSDGLELDVESGDFARLSAICSSQFRPSIKSVHFVHDPEIRTTRPDIQTCPQYSAVRDITFESHLEMLFSARALKKVLQQTNNLETFTFSPVKGDKGACWCKLYRIYRRHARVVGDDTNGDRDKVNTILSGIKSDCLSELNFTSTVLCYKPLTSLLERHRGTIRKLSIRRCELIGGTWIDLLEWFSDNLSFLERLSLQNLQELKWRRAFNKYDHSEMMWPTVFTTTKVENLHTYIATLRRDGDSYRSHIIDRISAGNRPLQIVRCDGSNVVWTDIRGVEAIGGIEEEFRISTVW